MKYSQLTENKHQYEFKHKYSIEISIVKRKIVAKFKKP